MAEIQATVSFPSSNGQNKSKKTCRVRQRKEHSKRRGSCITCRQRHMRCDQRKPICINCLVRPGDCGYEDLVDTPEQRKLLSPPLTQTFRNLPGEFLNPSRIDNQNVAVLLPQTSPIEVTSLSTFDPFGCLPMHNTRRNAELFHFYNDFHNMVCTSSKGLVHVGAVVEDVTHMKIILLMAAVRKMCFSRSSSGQHSNSYLACKLDVIQDANRLLTQPSHLSGTMVGAWLIASLLTVESACGEIKSAGTHARGLVAVRSESPLPSSVWGLLERNILIRTAIFSAAKKAAAKNQILSSSRAVISEAHCAGSTSCPVGPISSISQRVPLHQRPRSLQLPSTVAESAEGWAMVFCIYCHLVVGLGSNPRVPLDYNLLRWLLDLPPDEDTPPSHDIPGAGMTWMWKQAAGLYCLVVASSHPEVEAWARLPLDSPQRKLAEANDGDGLIQTRIWFDGLLRPGCHSGKVKHGEGTSVMTEITDTAERFLASSTAQAILDKLTWLEGREGRRLTTRLWNDCARQPHGLISLS